MSGIINPSSAVGGGGSGNYVQALVDFGFASGYEGDVAVVTVTGQTWVTSSSIIVCSAAGKATADHEPDEVAAEGIVAYASNLVAGTGFDITAKACGDSEGTWGQYYINASGA